jgi:hypothetical protein
MEPATASVRIKCPRAAVHALLADLSRHPEYLDHFLVDWAITSESAVGVGASASLRPKGGAADTIAIEITAVSDDVIVIDTHSGRRGARRMRLVYALADAPGGATQVTFTLDLLEGSIVDRTTWSLPRAHLERQYTQAMLRLKGLLEGEPRAL